ncbi:uncharacterized protein LOC132403197 [Hypanus sabinus]|uniref:uncharacterized protein LOC132403197 n=1 Tax=Hypanus sabinus TaxID=79690 RepID=UPI0028C4830C|nr:uncharacterized protein LOC132403197 [Hypanus sabinus]XP_059842547.1 uncharacterized protein LOC132403197 [Hypanus sabinus]
MDSILRLEKLDVDPQDSEAALAFELWLACFQSYLEVIPVTEPATMYKILLSRVSPKVFSLIRDLPTYQGALDAPKRQYLQLVNTVYARHRLATRRQRADESSAEFLRALQTLVRTCDCKALTAEQHLELLVRDIFVTGLRSVYVRQRLLENADLTLRSVIKMADTLEAALHNADAVQPRDPPPVPWTPQSPPPVSEFTATAASRESTNSPKPTTAAASRKSAQCYFCRLEKHPRKRCPAREATCSTAGRRAISPRSVSLNHERGRAALRVRHGGRHLACPPRARHGGGHLCQRHLTPPPPHRCLPGTKVAIQLWPLTKAPHTSLQGQWTSWWRGTGLAACLTRAALRVLLTRTWCNTADL